MHIIYKCYKLCNSRRKDSTKTMLGDKNTTLFKYLYVYTKWKRYTTSRHCTTTID